MSTSTLRVSGWGEGLLGYPQPLSQHARPAFTVRGTCDVCGLTDVACTTDSVCALCTMQGRA